MDGVIGLYVLYKPSTMRTKGVLVRSCVDVDGMGTSVAYVRDNGPLRQEEESGDNNCRILRKVDIVKTQSHRHSHTQYFDNNFYTDEGLQDISNI